MEPVTNRHIRKNWATFVDHSDSNQVTAVCGVRSSNSTVGIPLVTHSAMFYSFSVYDKRNAWCLRCIYLVGDSLLDVEAKVHPDVLSVRETLLNFCQKVINGQ